MKERSIEKGKRSERKSIAKERSVEKARSTIEETNKDEKSHPSISRRVTPFELATGPKLKDNISQHHLTSRP